MEGNGSPGLGELARSVQDVVIRFEKLGVRLETQFLRTDLFDLYKQSTDKELSDMQKEIDELKDDKKWLTRLVIGLIVVGLVSVGFSWSLVGGKT